MILALLHQANDIFTYEQSELCVSSLNHIKGKHTLLVLDPISRTGLRKSYEHILYFPRVCKDFESRFLQVADLIPGFPKMPDV